MNISNTTNEQKTNENISNNEVLLYIKNILKLNTKIINTYNISEEEYIIYIKKIIKLKNDFDFSKISQFDSKILYDLLLQNPNSNIDDIYFKYNDFLSRLTYKINKISELEISDRFDNSDAVFDAKKQVKDILKAKKNQRKKELQDFKENFIYQQSELALLLKRAEDLLSQNQDIELSEFIERINIKDIFSKTQMAIIFDTIFEYFYKREINNAYYEKYKNKPKLLIKEIFWAEIKWKVTLLKKEANLVFLIEKEFDFLKIRKFNNIFSAIKEKIFNLNKQLGFFLLDNNLSIKDLKWQIIVINSNYWNIDATIKHEIQHSRNKLIFWEFDFKKDEVIARLADWTKSDNLAKIIFSKNSSYDSKKNNTEDEELRKNSLSIARLKIIEKIYGNYSKQILTILDRKEWKHILKEDIKTMKKLTENEISNLKKINERITEKELRMKNFMNAQYVLLLSTIVVLTYILNID